MLGVSADQRQLRARRHAVVCSAEAGVGTCTRARTQRRHGARRASEHGRGYLLSALDQAGTHRGCRTARLNLVSPHADGASLLEAASRARTTRSDCELWYMSSRSSHSTASGADAGATRSCSAASADGRWPQWAPRPDCTHIGACGRASARRRLSSSWLPGVASPRSPTCMARHGMPASAHGMPRRT